MIDKPQPKFFNVGVVLCPPLMGAFDYPPHFDDVKMISVVPDQPRAEIFQLLSFRMTNFHDLCTLPSPSASIKGRGHPSMAIPFSTIEVAYSIF
jgi:hypothetical protein